MFKSSLLIYFASLSIIFCSDFSEQKIDDLSRYDSVFIKYLEKINAIDKKYFLGKTLLVPASLEQAESYCPLYDFRADLALIDSAIVVYRERNLLGVYQKGSLIYWAPITRARSLQATTPGQHRVRSKHRLMYSKKYGNVPMPFSLVIVGNVCIHQGPMVGRPASHGCVRLFRRDAEWLYAWAKVGIAVWIE